MKYMSLDEKHPEDVKMHICIQMAWAMPMCTENKLIYIQNCVKIILWMYLIPTMHMGDILYS